MRYTARWTAFLLLSVLCGYTASLGESVTTPKPSLAFSDSFANGIPKEYRTKGEASARNGLHLQDQSAVFHEVDGHGEVLLDFSIDTAAVTEGDLKFQAQIKIDNASVNVQLAESSAGSRLIMFTYRESLPPEDYREFPYNGPITGRWQVRLLYGLLLVTKDGKVVGQDGVSTVDSKFAGVMLASIRGAFSIHELTVHRLLDAPLNLRDEQELAEADVKAGLAQQASLYSKYEEATALMQQVYSTYSRILGPRAVRAAWAEGALGSFLTHSGVTGAARSHIENALQTFEQTLGADHPLTATAQLMMANLLIGIDDVDQGYPAAERALSTAISVYGNHSPTVAAALSTYAAGNLKNGNPAKAAEALATALSIREDAFGKGDLHLTPYMMQLGELYEQLEDFPKASSLLNDACKILESSVDPNPANLLRVKRSLAEIELRRGNYAAAAAAYDGLASKAAIEFGRQHPNVALILHDGALAHLAEGDLRTAETKAREALAITVTRAREIAEQLSEAEALSFLPSVYPVRDALLSVELKTSGHLTLKQYQELGQARGIYTQAEMIASGAYGLTGILDNQTAKDLSELADVRSFLAGFASYHGAMAQDDRIPAVMSLITQEKERLQREISNREFARLRQSDSTINLDELLDSIGNDSAIVETVAANIWTVRKDGSARIEPVAHYYVFVVSKNAAGAPVVTTVDLGSRSDMDQHISQWLALLGGRSADNENEALEAKWIYERVWKPLVRELHGAHNILIVPDGMFNVMPWAALRSTTNERFLVEDGYSFVNELSVEAIREVVSRREKAVGAGTLLVGDLDFGKAVPGHTREIYVGATSEGIWTALQGARAEIAAIEPLARQAGLVTVLSDTKATEIAVEREMPNFRFVHFATHGYFAQTLQSAPKIAEAGAEFLNTLSLRSQRSPLLRNGLVLSGANLDPTFERGTVRINDGLLSAEEIAGLNLGQVELVVLSACETARGVDIVGEGSFGLRRTFLMAGTRTVVAGLWRVNDLATKDLMVKFYQLLWRDKHSKAEALRLAQVYMIDKGRKYTDKNRDVLPLYSPYYWAAFMTSGDWK